MADPSQQQAAAEAAAGAGGPASGDAAAGEGLAVAQQLVGLLGDGYIVEFMIEPDGSVEPVSLPVNLSVRQLRDALAHDIGIPSNHMVLRFGGRFAHPDTTLEEQGLLEGRTNRGVISIDESQTGEDYVMPAELVLPLEDDETGEALGEMVILVQKQQDKKPYMGGFRNKENGVTFLHAATQTPVHREKPWEGKAPKESRATQTVKLVSRSQQTKREASTQMARKDVYVDGARDKVLVPGPYFTADQLMAVKEEKSVVLQRYWRGFVARNEASRRRAELAEVEADKERRRRELEEAELRRRERETRRRENPTSKKDFQVLFGELEAWRVERTRQIEEEVEDEDERQAARERLLAEEMEQLKGIERKRIAAGKRGEHGKVMKRLDAMAGAKAWEMGDGSVAEIETPFTVRARELRDLYASLAAAGTPREQREQLLQHVQFTVKEFDCGLTREIVELADREADMLARGRPAKRLAGLRRRLLNLFLQFVETPEFNPEAARFQKVPRDLAQRPNVMPIVK